MAGRGGSAGRAILPLGRGHGRRPRRRSRALDAKLDDYFTRCRLAAFDPRAAEPLNPPLAAYAALAAQAMRAGARRGRGAAAGADRGRAAPAARGRAQPRLGGGASRAFARRSSCRCWASATSLTEEDVAGAQGDASPPSSLARAQAGAPRSSRSASRAFARSPASEPAPAHRRADRPRQGARARDERDRRGREAGRASARPLPLLNNFVSFRDFYTRSEQGGVPGRHALSRWPQLRPLRHGRGRGKHAQLADPEPDLPGLLRLHAPGRDRRR